MGVVWIWLGYSSKKGKIVYKERRMTSETTKPNPPLTSVPSSVNLIGKKEERRGINNFILTDYLLLQG